MISILTPGNIILAVFAYYFLRLVIESVYYRFFHPLSKFPGPFWASISRLWIAYHNLKEDELYLILKLHQQYGMKSSMIGNASMTYQSVNRTSHTYNTHVVVSQRCHKTSRYLPSLCRQNCPLCYRQFWCDGIGVQHAESPPACFVQKAHRWPLQLLKHQEDGTVDGCTHQ